jgi:light-harvesting complex I chlorophyll a/b binding protein 1
MKIAASILALAGSAAAFAPAQSSGRASTAVSAGMTFEDRPGVIQPTGYFDPLGLATSEETFALYRSVELKHGRVAQLAVLGYIVPEFFRWGGDIAPGLKFADVPNGIAAINAIPALGWLQMFFLIGAVDYYGFLGNYQIVRSPLTK